MKIEDFDDTKPIFTPEEFFDGEIEGWAVIEGPLGGLQRRASIKAQGTWRPEQGLITFTETWTFDDAHVDVLAWTIRRHGKGRYSGTAPTVVGEAAGEQAGCAFHWTYTRDVPSKDGSEARLNFDDWFYRIDDGGVIVKGTAGRLGLPFATAFVTYRKL